LRSTIQEENRNLTLGLQQSQQNLLKSQSDLQGLQAENSQLKINLKNSQDSVSQLNQ